jgi:hypothetical protein
MRQCRDRCLKSTKHSTPLLNSSTREPKTRVRCFCCKLANYLGWICKLALSEIESELDKMLTREQYDAYLTSQDHGEEGEEEEDDEYEEEEEEEEEKEKKKK